MRIRITLCLFFGLMAASCHKASPPASAPQAPTDGGWTEFTSKEDGFVVSFPTSPVTNSKDNQYDFGKVTIRAYTSNPRRNVVWRVGTHNYPETYTSQIKPEKLLTLMRDGMAANVKGRVEGTKDVSLDGHVGQEFLVQGPDPLTNKPLTVKVRLLAVGGRVYQIMVTAPAQDEAWGDDATRFFASFRLVK
jgi:hypothetical protein